MKMIVAIVDNTISSEISQALLESNFRVTQLATTGGLFRSGSTTLMIGVDNEKVESALQKIRETVPKPENPKNIQATIYVLNIKNFNRL